MRKSVEFEAPELFSFEEIAIAAGVAEHDVRAALDPATTVFAAELLSTRDAVALVSRLEQAAPPVADGPAPAMPALPTSREPITLLPEPRRRTGASLVASGVVHAAALLAIVAAVSFGLLAPTQPLTLPVPQANERLVYLIAAGPGGGGGGGGNLEFVAPPPPARQAAPPRPPRPSVPAIRRRPPVRSTARLPRPVAPPLRLQTPRPLPRPAPRVVEAPVAPAPSSVVTRMGDAAPASPITSAGPGRGGSVGSGQGDGIGRGAGAGVGPGTGGGTGGGRFGPGSGVTPPTVIREVRPAYTEEARRRAIEGAVELELVVLADGRVGSVHVVRGLGAGLDERAALAARDWRFNPATRRGTPIDVVVNVRMQFSLR